MGERESERERETGSLRGVSEGKVPDRREGELEDHG